MSPEKPASLNQSMLLRRRYALLAAASLNVTFLAPATAELRTNPFVDVTVASQPVAPLRTETFVAPRTENPSTSKLPTLQRPRRLPPASSDEPSQLDLPWDLPSVEANSVDENKIVPIPFLEQSSQSVIGEAANTSEHLRVEELFAAFAEATPLPEPFTSRSEPGNQTARVPLAGEASETALDELLATQSQDVAKSQDVTKSQAIVSNPQASLASNQTASFRPNRLQSTTSTSIYRDSRQILDQAIKEYQVGAWASSEASTWTALRGFADAADLQQATDEKQSFASALSFAATAIVESRDFCGQPASAVSGIAISHQTKLLSVQRARQISSTDAIDLYLDEARIRLGSLAAESVDSAEAMDLLAAIYLGRNESSSMPAAASLCLRRAALQGQPGNGSLATRLGMQLATTGLHEEAYLVLKHAYELLPADDTAAVLSSVANACGQVFATPESLAQNQAKSTVPGRPDVIQLSPSEFASISKPVIQLASAKETRSDAVTAAFETASESTSSDIADGQDSELSEPPSAIKRITGSFKRLWK